MLQLAEIHLRRSEWEQTVQRCEDAAALNPLHEEQWNTLAAALRQLGRTAEEEEALRRALAVNPGSDSARNRLMQLRKQGKGEL